MPELAALLNGDSVRAICMSGLVGARHRQALPSRDPFEVSRCNLTPERTSEVTPMWIITGVLLGLLCLTAVVGFHFGPHAHVVAVAMGALVACWFIYLMSERGPGPVLWTLLGTDVIVGIGVGALAWKGLSGGSTVTENNRRSPLEGAEGIAVSRLAPEGIVSVRGEHWSAISVNGTVAASTPVQVLRAVGVRLEVWGEDAETIPTDGLFDLRESNVMDQHQ